MSQFENHKGLEQLENLNELGKNVIENFDIVQPIEHIDAMDKIEKPNIEGLNTSRMSTISFKGGNCLCSCDLTCTRA